METRVHSTDIPQGRAATSISSMTLHQISPPVDGCKWASTVAIEWTGTNIDFRQEACAPHGFLNSLATQFCSHKANSGPHFSPFEKKMQPITSNRFRRTNKKLISAINFPNIATSKGTHPIIGTAKLWLAESYISSDQTWGKFHFVNSNSTQFHLVNSNFNFTLNLSIPIQFQFRFFRLFFA